MACNFCRHSSCVIADGVFPSVVLPEYDVAPSAFVRNFVLAELGFPELMSSSEVILSHRPKDETSKDLRSFVLLKIKSTTSSHLAAGSVVIHPQAGNYKITIVPQAAAKPVDESAGRSLGYRTLLWATRYRRYNYSLQGLKYGITNDGPRGQSVKRENRGSRV
ncbi:hypothetical protein V1478_014330 [Vespula squamosa]|uniref:Uncharacterized protein n=1 Tax=Vespula squamosa TaxID=30214 RepID=A0ABD2A7P8_VESSQ